MSECARKEVKSFLNVMDAYNRFFLYPFILNSDSYLALLNHINSPHLRLRRFGSTDFNNGDDKFDCPQRKIVR